jgi:hypothetical protein
VLRCLDSGAGVLGRNESALEEPVAQTGCILTGQGHKLPYTSDYHLPARLLRAPKYRLGDDLRSVERGRISRLILKIVLGVLGIRGIDGARFDESNRYRQPLRLNLHPQRVSETLNRVFRGGVHPLQRNP